MSVFDALAETRYQQWRDRQPESPKKQAADVDKTASRKSFEGLLYQDILRLLEKAAESDCSKAREQYLQQAQALEMQLFVSLEKRCLHKVSVILQKSISHKKQLLDP